MITLTNDKLEYHDSQTILHVKHDTQAIIWQGSGPIIAKKIVDKKGIRVWGCPEINLRLGNESFINSLTKLYSEDRDTVEVICGQVYKDGEKQGKPYLMINFRALGASNLGEMVKYQNVVMYNCKHKETYITEKIHKKFRTMLREVRANCVLQSTVTFNVSRGMKLVEASTDINTELSEMLFRNYGTDFLHKDSDMAPRQDIIISMRVSSTDRKCKDKFVVGGGKDIAKAITEALGKVDKIAMPDKYARVSNIIEDLAKVQNDKARIL